MAHQIQFFLKRYSAVFIILVLGINTNAQIRPMQITGSQSIISTAVPFITIGPDAKANSLGGCGVASSPDINSQHQE